MNKRQRKKKLDKAWLNVTIPRSRGKGKSKLKFNVQTGALAIRITRSAIATYSVPKEYQYYRKTSFGFPDYWGGSSTGICRHYRIRKTTLR